MENPGVRSDPGMSAETERASRAASRLAVPLWYWGGVGLLFGFEVAAVSSGRVAVMCITSVLVLFAGRGLNALLSSKRGIRIGRMFGGAGSWLAAPWFGVLIALCVCGTLVSARQGTLWPAVLAGVVAVFVTLGFGYGYDRARLRRAGLPGR